MQAILEAPLERLEAVPDVGPVVAASVRAFADEPHNRALIEKLARAGVNMESRLPEVRAAHEGPLAGKTFVLTGTLSTMTREAAESAIEAARRQGLRVDQPQDQLSRGRRRRRQQTGEGPTAWASSELTEDEFRQLIMNVTSSELPASS